MMKVISCHRAPCHHNLFQSSEIWRLSSWQCSIQKTQMRTRQLEDIHVLGRSNQAVTYCSMVSPSSHFKHRQRKLRKSGSGVVLAVQAALAVSKQRGNLLCIFAISRPSEGAKLLRFEPILGGMNICQSQHIKHNIYILCSEAGKSLHVCLLGLKHQTFIRLILDASPRVV